MFLYRIQRAVNIYILDGGKEEKRWNTFTNVIPFWKIPI